MIAIPVTKPTPPMHAVEKEFLLFWFKKVEFEFTPWHTGGNLLFFSRLYSTGKQYLLYYLRAVPLYFGVFWGSFDDRSTMKQQKSR